MTTTPWVRLLSLVALVVLAAAPVLAAEPAADLSPQALFAPAPEQCAAPAVAGTLELGKGGPPQPPGGGVCGSAVCTKDQFCCNESCSICAPLGGACTQQVCFSDGPFPVS